ncbi:hypothetical protein INS49_008456 [Diaporthe citri]|uniref:uncharacterized protein n=1 Tax=Diaporthe citri TaxID=83186 RepID=UPI001C7EAD34|nr:uncharacterized protein INS49_008456 [Diaporthe citri]KAG6363359.1 hypothetical protein INS49_008456 [Diaporthe citri]
MALYTKLPDTIDEADVIIAGGGTAGCVVASRLADADPGLSILAIEGGPNSDLPTVEIPASFLAHLSPESKTNRFYLTKKSPEVADRSLIIPTGGFLGGGSSTNFMMYSRAQRSDWGSWNTPGWSADEMLPFLKKLETYHGDDAKGIHGHEGPIHISRGTYNSPRIQDEFIAAAKNVGWLEVPDLSDLDSINAICRAKRFISPSGKRQDVVSTYLHPRLRDGKHPNLQSFKKAYGSDFRPNPVFHTDGMEQPPRRVGARKLVIASGGACGTLPLLERSGVGDSEILTRAGVPVLVDLPGAGNGYEDHHLLVYPYFSNLVPADTLDKFIYGSQETQKELIETKHKMLGWNAQEVQGKVRPTETEVIALGPEFQAAWDREFKPNPDKPLAIITAIAGFPGDPRLTTGDPCLSTTVFTVHPFSRGHIHITCPGVDDPVDFETGFFADPGQLDMAACHPPFAADSGAALVRLTDGPLHAGVPDIEYSAEDDAVLERWLRENVGTTWHSVGTCKMLPRDEMGVVDPSLGACGVRNLKIADLSIPPRNVAANTNSTALAIGEKAADIFIRELGLGSV